MFFYLFNLLIIIFITSVFLTFINKRLLLNTEQFDFQALNTSHEVAKHSLLLLQAHMQNVFHFCLTVIPMVFSLSVFNVITDSMLTKSVPSSDTGDAQHANKIFNHLAYKQDLT